MWAKGLGLSQNRRVSGQRMCLLLFSQISIFEDHDVPAFSKAGTFFSPILKKQQRNVRCIVEGFLKISRSFFRTKGENMSVCYMEGKFFALPPPFAETLSVVKWEETTCEAESWQTASFCPLESRKGNLEQSAGLVSPSSKLFQEIWDKTGLWFT